MSTRVLLVDPEEILLDTYRDYLTAHGFDVEAASAGPDALSKLRLWKPDVLILEPDMPGGCGDKILEEVRNHPELWGVPVLILSRRDRKVVTYPVREYHVKPFSLAALVKSIRVAANPSSASSP